jgi:acylglycerol lipase
VTIRAAGSLEGEGGLRLHTESWQPDDDAATVRGVVVIVHGLGEHSGRYDHVGDRLAREGFVAHALDHRGHGRSEGPREVIDTAAVVADVDRLVDAAVAAHPGVALFVLGHSLGGMIAVAYAIAHGPRLTGLILSGPLAQLDAPAALQRIVRGLAAVAPRTPTIALDAALVSRDPAVLAAYRADPLVHHGRIPAITVAEISRTTAGFPDAVSAITVATLILYGTADGLCPPAGSVMLGERIGAADLTIRAYDGLYHEVLNEPERETVLGDLVGWLDAHAPPAPAPPTA